MGAGLGEDVAARAEMGEVGLEDRGVQRGVGAEDIGLDQRQLLGRDAAGFAAPG